MPKKNFAVLALLFLGLFIVLNPASAGAEEVSRDARKYMLRGQAAMEEAKDVADYRDAVGEIKNAIKFAPNWADAWFNLGVAQENAKNFSGAIASFNKYLKLNPNAADSRTVEDRIIKLEYKQEKATQVKKRDNANLAGNWYRKDKSGTTKIVVSENRFELTQYYGPGDSSSFRGTINGDTISGSFIFDPSRCPSMETYSTGRVIDENRIELDIVSVHTYYDSTFRIPSKRCTIVRTMNEHWILLRKK